MSKPNQIPNRVNALKKSNEQRNAELGLFSSIQEALLSRRDMSFIFELVGNKLHEMFEGYVISIATFDHETGTEHFQYHFEEGKRSFPEPRPYNKIRQILIDSRQLVVVNEKATDFVNELIGANYFIEADIAIPRSFLFAPLMVDDIVKGYISLKHYQQETVFDEEHIRLLNTIAGSISVTLQSEKLILTEQRKTAEQKALLDTMADLSSKLELKHLLSSVLERAVSLLKVTGAELAIYHDGRKELEVVASYNLGMTSGGVYLKHGEGAMGRVAETLQPLIIPDYQGWDGRSDKYAQYSVKSVMVVPLLIGNQLVGALASVHLEEGHHFGDADLNLLNMFAPLAATAIENARLFNKTTLLLEEAENRATELKLTQDQLVRQEKLASLGELTAGIAHEIQNPLNFVNNFSEVNTELIDEAGEEINKGNISEAKIILNDIKENSEKISHHGKRAGDIVKSMLQHSHSSNGLKEATDINALADEYLKLAYHGLRAKDKNLNATMKTDYDDSIGKINIIPQDIGRVILNLINNAFYVVNEKKMQQPNGYEPTVSVTTKKKGDTVLISVKDNGNGIPQKILNKIFQPFFTTKPTGQGTGLGLSLSFDIVKAHGGDITVSSTTDIGSEFVILLPNNIH